MKYDLKNIYEDFEEILGKVYKIQNISETIQNAMAYCAEDSHDNSHILEVVKYLNSEIDIIASEMDIITSKILIITLDKKP